MSSSRTVPRRRLAIALGLLVVLAIGVRAALPLAAATLIEERAAAALGRNVRIGDVDLALLAGRAAVRGIEVGGPIGAAVATERPPVRVAGLSLGLSWPALLGGEVRLTHLGIDAPRLDLARDERGAVIPLVLATDPETASADDSEPAAIWPLRLDRLDVRDVDVHVDPSRDASHSDLRFTLASLSLDELAFVDGAVSIGGLSFEDPGLRLRREFATAGAAPAGAEDAAASPQLPAAAPPAPEPPELLASRTPTSDPGATPGPAPSHRIEKLEVRDARFTLLWEGGEPLDVTLDFSARQVSTARDASIPLELGLSTEQSQVAVEGELTLEPLAFDGELRWEGLRLPRLLEASGVEVGLALTSGLTDGSLRLRLVTLPEPDAAVSLVGQATVRDVDGSMEDLTLAWSNLSVDLEEARVPLAAGVAPSARIARVEWVAPRVVFTRMPPAPAAGDAAGTPADVPAPAPDVEVASLAVRDGDVRFVDRTLPREVTTRWRQLSIDASGLRWPDGDAERLQLSARGAGGARIGVDASASGAASGGTARVKTSLTRLGLAAFDPYAAAFTGLRVRGGEASVESTVEISGTRTVTDSDLDLHALDVEERKPGWFQRVFGMPLDVALALLRDLNGDIALPVHAELGPEATQVGIASLVASALRQAIVGAATSPLKLLGGAVKLAGDAVGAGLPPLAVEAGSPELSEAGLARLSELAAVLQARPTLRLELHGRAGPADDAGIARRVLLAQARAGASLAGDDALGFFERRSLRGALAQSSPDPVAELDEDDARAWARLVERFEVTAEQRDALARERAQRVLDALVREHEVAAEAAVVADVLAGAPAVVLEWGTREAS